MRQNWRWACWTTNLTQHVSSRHDKTGQVISCRVEPSGIRKKRRVLLSVTFCTVIKQNPGAWLLGKSWRRGHLKRSGQRSNRATAFCTWPRRCLNNRQQSDRWPFHTRHRPTGSVLQRSSRAELKDTRTIVAQTEMARLRYIGYMVAPKIVSHHRIINKSYEILLKPAN